MTNSGNTTRSAPAARACARAARALAALPATSPTAGFNWASVTVKWVAGSVMERWCLARGQTAIAWSDRAYALGDGEQPEQARHDQRDAHRRRAHILDPADLRIMLGGQPVGELLDRGIEQFDHQHQGDGGDQLDAAHHGRAD